MGGGVPTLDGKGTSLGWGDLPCIVQVTYPGQGGYLSWNLERGVPTMDGGTYPGWGGGYLPWKGVRALDGGPYLGQGAWGGTYLGPGYTPPPNTEQTEQ